MFVVLCHEFGQYAFLLCVAEAQRPADLHLLPSDDFHLVIVVELVEVATEHQNLILLANGHTLPSRLHPHLRLCDNGVALLSCDAFSHRLSE